MIKKRLSTEEVCRRYGMEARQTLYRHVKKRIFPAPTGKIGRSYAWDADVLDAFDDMMKKNALKNATIATANIL